MTAVRLAVAVAAGGMALAAFCAPVDSEFNAAEIVKRSVVVNSADWNAQPEFSHCSRYQRRKTDASGKAVVEQQKTYETLMIAGSPYERVLAINGEALSGEEQQQEQLKLNHEIARRESESQAERRARISKYESARNEEHMLMQQMVEAFTFTIAGEQQVEGVDCYVLDAQPNPSYEPPVQKARVLLGMRGQLWIDKEHYHWVKVQAEVIHPVEFGMFIAKVKPGTRFELEQSPVGDVWLPKHFSQSVNASVLGFFSMQSTEEEQYLDYRSNLLAAKTHFAPLASSAYTRNVRSDRPSPSNAEIAAR